MCQKTIRLEKIKNKITVWAKTMQDFLKFGTFKKNKDIYLSIYRLCAVYQGM